MIALLSSRLSVISTLLLLAALTLATSLLLNGIIISVILIIWYNEYFHIKESALKEKKLKQKIEYMWFFSNYSLFKNSRMKND